MGGKTVIEALDWKETTVYKDYIIKRLNNKLPFESATNEFLREDEIDYVRLMVFKRLKEAGNQPFSQEVKKLCEPLIRKCYNSLELLIKELLTEDYFMLEFDKIFLERDFDGNPVKKLQYLLDRLVTFFSFREEALAFLYKVQDREVSL